MKITVSIDNCIVKIERNLENDSSIHTAKQEQLLEVLEDAKQVVIELYNARNEK